MADMRFGVREICDVTFRPLTATDIGNQHFRAMQPCLYIDSATTSSLESASTTVYATGGKGNSRLIAWEGEKTVTFTVTDALMSPVSFAMLSGAGVVDHSASEATVHAVYDEVISGTTVDISEELDQDTLVTNDTKFPIYGMVLDGETVVEYLAGSEITVDESGTSLTVKEGFDGYAVRIDCYVKSASAIKELEVDANCFAGYYYIEADTLFRDEKNGQDFPATFVIPKGKIQSNFTFTMASSGDPSTFDFTIDAFPAATNFNPKKKVLFTLQIVDSSETPVHHESAIYDVDGGNALTSRTVNVEATKADGIKSVYYVTAGKDIKLTEGTDYVKTLVGEAGNYTGYTITGMGNYTGKVNGTISA